MVFHSKYNHLNVQSTHARGYLSIVRHKRVYCSESALVLLALSAESAKARARLPGEEEPRRSCQKEGKARGSSVAGRRHLFFPTSLFAASPLLRSAAAASPLGLRSLSSFLLRRHGLLQQVPHRALLHRGRHRRCRLRPDLPDQQAAESGRGRPARVSDGGSFGGGAAGGRLGSGLRLRCWATGWLLQGGPKLEGHSSWVRLGWDERFSPFLQLPKGRSQLGRWKGNLKGIS